MPSSHLESLEITLTVPLNFVSSTLAPVPDPVVVAGGAGEEVEDEHQHWEETDQGGVNQPWYWEKEFWNENESWV